MDKLVLQKNRGADEIRSFTAVPIDDFTDVIQLGSGLSFDQLSFVQSGKNTRIFDAAETLLATVRGVSSDTMINEAFFK